VESEIALGGSGGGRLRASLQATSPIDIGRGRVLRGEGRLRGSWDEGAAVRERCPIREPSSDGARTTEQRLPGTIVEE
jgi:hypothetical protein